MHLSSVAMNVVDLSNIFFTLTVVISNSVITIIQFDNKSYNAHN